MYMHSTNKRSFDPPVGLESQAWQAPNFGSTGKHPRGEVEEVTTREEPRLPTVNVIIISQGRQWILEFPFRPLMQRTVGHDPNNG